MVEAAINGSEFSEANRIPKQIIVVCGPEGSGKSTQGDLLSKELSVPRIAMGDVFRELAKQETDLGKRSQRMLEEHKYSDIGIFSEAFAWRMQRADVKDGFVIDGGLRFEDEVEHFSSLLEKAGLGDFSIKVLYLRLPGWASVERLMERGRLDDTEEGILKRLSNHYANLGKRMVNASSKWSFSIINAVNKPVNAVHQEIMTKVKEESGDN